MPYVTELLLENFRSHVKTHIALAGPGLVTVLTGPTDSGKTNIIRAFRWVAHNEPSGDGFIRIGAQLCRVTITLDDGTRVIRERSRGGINRYTLVKPDAKPLVFEGFGGDVPLEIRQALKTNEFRIGDLTIRPALAEQLDGPFLGKSMPATARAKVLGFLSGTDAVDVANKAVGTDLYRANREAERLEADLKENERSQTALAWVEPMGATLERLTQIQATVNAADARRIQIGNLSERVIQNRRATEANQATLNRLARVPQATGRLSQVVNNTETSQRLSAIAPRLEDIATQLFRVEYDITRLSKVPDTEAKLAEVSTRAERLGRLTSLAERLAANTKQHEVCVHALSRLATVPSADKALSEAEKTASRLERLHAVWGRLSGLVMQEVAAHAATLQADSVPTAQAHLTKVAETAARLERLSSLLASANSNREALDRGAGRVVILENEVAQAQGAYNDAIQCMTVECPECGHQFVPEILKEVA